MRDSLYEYKLKRCSNKECCKKYRYVKCKGTNACTFCTKAVFKNLLEK